MRLRIAHEIATEFDAPVSHLNRELRITPRTYDGQYVGGWRIDVDHDCRLDRVFDAHGNVLHTFSVPGPLTAITISVNGEVEVDDTAGIVQATNRERLPAALFLRSTRLTEPDAAIRDLAADVAAAAASPLDRCHALKSLLFARLAASGLPEADLSGPSAAAAAGVLGRAEATPTEIVHVFLATARLLGLPARFVSGYLWRGDRRDAGEAAHAWAEVHVEGLGWVGFDPPNDRCPTDAYVRVAASHDQHGASFLRGAEQGAAKSATTSRVMITQAEF